MAHSTLSEKLDQIKSEELGFFFDTEATWVNLESQLGQKSRVIERWWLMAACVFLLVFLAPLTILRETPLTVVDTAAEVSLAESDGSIDPAVIREVEEREAINLPIRTIAPKKIELAFAKVEMKALSPLSVHTISLEKEMKPRFADEDISIIQASLGTPTIEKEKSVTISAQLNTSSQPVQLNNQAFKIRLFDKSNQ